MFWVGTVAVRTVKCRLEFSLAEGVLQPAGAAMGMEIPTGELGILMGMGMGAVINFHGSVGILWGFLNGCAIRWRRDKCDKRDKCYKCHRL